MINILAIGNSFSQDATHYLHQIAEADGIDMKVVNLFIGGCSLERHWHNLKHNSAEYLVEENGASTGRYASSNSVLADRKWDIIVTQQASHLSGLKDTYYPYIDNIAAYIKENAPQAELLLHETWAYEIDSLHDMFKTYGYSRDIMHQRLSEAYKTAAAKLGVRMIPSGDIIQKLRKIPPFVYEDGGMSLCRDGFHMNVIYGRYLLAAIWYRFITGNKIGDNAYIPATPLAPNAVCRQNMLNIIKNTIDEEL